MAMVFTEISAQHSTIWLTTETPTLFMLWVMVGLMTEAMAYQSFMQ